MPIRRFLLACAALMLGAASASAQSNPRYIQFSPGETKGALYTPDSGASARVAFLVMHRTSNFLSHISTRELAKRGFTVLGMNPRFDNNPASVDWEQIALDVRQGVRYLRKLPGIEKIILIGHSGGGATMSFYQSVAEVGPSVCQGANKLVECSAKDLEGFQPADRADGIVFMDAHPANGANALRALNGAVMDDDHPFAPLNPALDPFSPANGFNAKGDSTYSPAFIDAYARAQSARMNRLIDKALAIRAKMAEGSYQPSDDDVFPLYRVGADLRETSTTVRLNTDAPRALVKNDGSIDASHVIQSVVVPNPGTAGKDKAFNLDYALTIKSFLSSRAIRSTHSLDDVDWCSSNNNVPCAVRSISVPILVLTAGGYHFVRDAETIFQNAKGNDKQYFAIEGSAHGFIPCTPCERTEGEITTAAFDLKRQNVAKGGENGKYSNVTKNTFDTIATWTRARF